MQDQQQQHNTTATTNSKSKSNSNHDSRKSHSALNQSNLIANDTKKQQDELKANFLVATHIHKYSAREEERLNEIDI